MAFDPSIISAIPDYAGNPVQAQEKALTIKDMMNRNQLNQLQLGAAQKEAREQSQVDDILKKSDVSTPEGLAKAAADVNRVSPRASRDILKWGQQYQSGQIQQQLDQLTLAGQRQDLIVGAIDPIVAQARQMKNNGASDFDVKAFITAQMPQALQNLRGQTLGDGKPALPDDVLKMATNIPGGYTLATLEGWEAKSKAGKEAIAQRLNQFKADTQARREEESERHNREMEGQGNKRIGNASGAGDFGGSVGQVLAAMADIGVALPTGLRAKQQMLGTIQALIERHPDEGADQIAKRVRAGQIETGAAKTEANVVARREGSAAAAINALNREGGLYDQLQETAKKVDFGSAKFVNALKLWKAGDVIADPNISEYVNALADTRAEFASVLSRGGQVTDSVRIAAEHAFPDKMSLPELERAVERSKKIARAIQAGNSSVLDALVHGKSMDEALKSGGETDKGGGDTKTGKPETPPAPKFPAALQPGATYRHSSGATIEILPE